LRTNPTQWWSSKSNTEINQISIIFQISLPLAIGSKTSGRILHCKLRDSMNHGMLSFLHHYWNCQKNAIYWDIIFQNICSANVMIKTKHVPNINQRIQLIQYVMLRIKITHQPPKTKIDVQHLIMQRKFYKSASLWQILSYTAYFKMTKSQFQYMNHTYIFRRRLHRSSRQFITAISLLRYLLGPHSCLVHRLCTPDELHQAIHPGIPMNQQPDQWAEFKHGFLMWNSITSIPSFWIKRPSKWLQFTEE